MKGSKRTLEELRWEIMGSLQNLSRAASLCAWCIKVVEEIGVSGAEGGGEGVTGTMVTSIAIYEKGEGGVSGGGGEGRRPTSAGRRSWRIAGTR